MHIKTIFCLSLLHLCDRSIVCQQMGLAIYGASNITVDNLHIQETGGDGIYVGSIE